MQKRRAVHQQLLDLENRGGQEGSRNVIRKVCPKWTKFFVQNPAALLSLALFYEWQLSSYY